LAAISRLRGFVGQHRRRLFLGSLVVVTAYWFYKKIWPYLRQAYQMYRMMQQLQGPTATPDEQAKKAKEDRRKYAEKASIGSTEMVATDLKHLHNYLRNEAQLTEIEPFREKEAEARAKGKAAQKSIWSTLKIVAVTYAVSGMYAMAMHDLVKRMQMTIVAHYNGRGLEAKDGKKVSVSAQRTFFQLTNINKTAEASASVGSAPLGHLAHSGLPCLVKEVRQAVEEVVGPEKLRANFSKAGISRLLREVRQKVEAGGSAKLVSRIMISPERDQAATEKHAADLTATDQSITAEDLLNELRDWFFDHPDMDMVLEERLDAAFQHLEEKIAAKMYDAPAASQLSEGDEMSEPEMLRVFKAFDSNNDGSLEVSELVRFIKALKKKGDEEELNVEKILSLWDRDQSGTVDFAEFKARMSEYIKKFPAGKHILHSAAMEKHAHAQEKPFAILLPATKDVTAKMFSQDEDCRELVNKINDIESSRNFFTCLYWGGEDEED